MTDSRKPISDPLAGIVAQLGMLGVFFLTLAFSGFAVILCDLLGLPPLTGRRIPELEDARPLVISTLGFTIFGLTPLMFRLLFDDQKSDS